MSRPSKSLEEIGARVREAAARKTPLVIRGGGTKAFYGLPAANGETLDLREYAGAIAYEPSELFVTVRAGSRLAALERELDKRGQMLAFEPPHFGEGATVGGTVAAGLAGPRRARAGGVRDYVLGVTVVDATGAVLHFGGKVMKNVAGYDVSRLMAGSLGTLGVIAEVTLKVVPRPVRELSVRLPMTQAEAITRMNEWAGQPLPISATAWHYGALIARLSGADGAVRAAAHRIGGERFEGEASVQFWRALRDQTHGFFAPRGDLALWRVAVPSTARPLDLGAEPTLEWNGGLRWLWSGEPQRVRAAAAAAGGHATLFRGPDALKQSAGVFQPLPPALMTLHRRVKHAFDPGGLFNPGRMYADL